MEVIYIILGWLLGILSPIIVKKISDQKEGDNLKKIIFSDLCDLKKRLAPLSYLVLPKYGKLDMGTFEWLKKNSDIDFIDGIQKFTEQGMNEETIIINLNQIGLGKKPLSYFKKVHLFAIDSHLNNLSLVDNALMSKVLEIKFHVEAFNEDVESFREHLKMTFQPGISEGNHSIISQELENKSLDIAKKSIYIVDLINEVLN